MTRPAHPDFGFWGPHFQRFGGKWSWGEMELTCWSALNFVFLGAHEAHLCKCWIIFKIVFFKRAALCPSRSSHAAGLMCWILPTTQREKRTAFRPSRHSHGVSFQALDHLTKHSFAKTGSILSFKSFTWPSFQVLEYFTKRSLGKMGSASSLQAHTWCVF